MKSDLKATLSVDESRPERSAKIKRRGRQSTQRGRGFSLLELVTVLAMVAVLIGYAVPSLFAYMARGHRIDAVIALHRAAQYLAGRVGVPDASAGVPLELPPGMNRSPPYGRATYRLVHLRADEAHGGYELRAIPVEDGPMHGDVCGTFVLDGRGVRSNVGPPGGRGGGDARTERCWSGRGA